MGTATAEASSHTHTVRHFGRLAGAYDRRYHHYTQQTLRRAVEALRLSGTERVLDIGSGTGELERLIRERDPRTTLVGVDVTPQMLAAAREKFRDDPKATFVLAQAESLPFASSEFDAVVSCNMLHHVGAPAVLFGEWARVLRAGGRMVLVDWCRDFWHCRAAHYWLRLVKPSYARMYRAAELVTLLESVGLTVREVTRFFVPPYFGMMRLCATKR